MESITILTVALELACVASLPTLSSTLNTKTFLTDHAKACGKKLKHLRSSVHIIFSTVPYHTKTLLLFIYSDLKQVLLPWALFGVGHALSTSLFHTPTQPALSILPRSPLVLLWLLINLLPFCIGNQRHPTAIQEDSVNKAWRPIPAQRITSTQACTLMITAYLSAFIASCYLGGRRQCVVLAVLGYCYNDLGGGDKSFFARNLLNGLGFVSFGSGAMEVAIGQDVVYTPELINWFALIVLVITTGIQTMDMYDQEGDKAVGRSTLPLAVGDLAARWSIVITTLAWSLVCPWYWTVGWAAHAIVLASGAIVAMRCLKERNMKDDKKTAKIWNLWLVAIYCLPLMKVLGL